MNVMLNGKFLVSLFVGVRVGFAFGAASHSLSSTFVTRNSVVAFTTRLVRPIRYHSDTSRYDWRVTPYASRNHCSRQRQFLTRMEDVNNNNEDDEDKSSMRGGERTRDVNHIMELSTNMIQYERSHASTICMVPPPVMEEVWRQLTKARTEVQDPGLFRWPPHANLIYPFFDFKHFDDALILEKLQRVASQTQPFCISLDKFGTFGGNHRGVLWLYPRSYYDENQTEQMVVVAQQHGDNHSIDNNDNEDVRPETEMMEKDTTKEPLVVLQALLEEQFPSQQGAAPMAIRPFAPHMTLSHYPSQQEALEALAQVESWWTPQSFVVNEIYVLVRDGDNGQFQRAITIPLGNHNSSNSDNNTLMVHRPTLSFPDMPKVEEDWVREERMKLKKRRNGRGGSGGRSRRRQTNDAREISGGRSRRPSTDTPEEIAAKRAARKAKREQLLQQDNQKISNPLDHS